MESKTAGYTMFTSTTGEGPPVVFLHSSAAGPSQWRAFTKLLAPQYQCFTPAMVGYPPSSPVASGTPVPPEVDIGGVVDLITQLGQPVHLVGHSYGGYIAARLALAHPPLIRSLALFEPVLFGALRNEPSPDAELARLDTLLPGFLDDAIGGTAPWLQGFIDYWNFPGSWAALPETHRTAIQASGWKIYQEVRAVGLGDERFATYVFPFPLLLVHGENTTAASLRMIAHVLAHNPTATHHVVAGGGHMFPISHGRETAPVLADFLASLREGG